MNRVFWLKILAGIVFICTTLAVAQEAQNVIKNPQFDDGTKSWKLQKETGTTAAIAVSGEALLSGPNSLEVNVTRWSGKLAGAGLPGVRSAARPYLYPLFFSQSGYAA